MLRVIIFHDKSKTNDDLNKTLDSLNSLLSKNNVRLGIIPMNNPYYIINEVLAKRHLLYDMYSLTTVGNFGKDKKDMYQVNALIDIMYMTDSRDLLVILNSGDTISDDIYEFYESKYKDKKFIMDKDRKIIRCMNMMNSLSCPPLSKDCINNLYECIMPHFNLN